MTLALLWSLNEQGRGREGLDIDFPDFGEIYADLIAYGDLQAEEVEKIKNPPKPTSDNWEPMEDE